jgi:DNA mismatch repair protein MutL
MTKILKLPNDLINKIAAGEVVERPSSIVKELVENSIDAKSNQISIFLKEGGIQEIKIIDNGLGLSSDQFSLLFERHATSKINSLQDLENNLHLGFRGEALASTASVAKVTFQSFPKNQESGYQIDHTGEISPVAMPHGTQIQIHDLFYNVPVRKKYLKNANTEYKHCLKILQEYAICHPEIGFSLTHNEKQIFDYRPTDRLGRLTQIFGEDLTSQLLPVYYSGADLKIEGFVGKPETAVSKKPHQHFLVNGRPIQTHTFAYSVKQAFGSLIFPQEKPQFFLWLNLDPQDVDMNVHPRKIEARFHFEGIIFRKIIRAVKDALQKTDLTKQIHLHKSSAESFLPNKSFQPNPQAKSNQSISFPTSSSYNIRGSKGSLVSYFNQNHQNNQSQRSPQSLEQTSEPTLIPLVQIENSYILCQSPEALVIIDQHAAHERVLYEKFKAEANAQEPRSQSLLTPIQVQLTTEQIETLNQASDSLQKIGFSISDLGDNTVAVNALPLKFSNNDLDKVIHGLLDDIEEKSDFQNLSEIEDIVINYAACRGAIKFGQPLTKDEMIALIKEMEAISHKQYSCPHGRPSKVEITFQELEKQFKRTK